MIASRPYFSLSFWIVAAFAVLWSFGGRKDWPLETFRPQGPTVFSPRFLQSPPPEGMDKALKARGFFFSFTDNRFKDVIAQLNDQKPLVGVFLPLSGDLAPLGQQLEKTVLMVYYQKSRPYHLRFYDTGGKLSMDDLAAAANDDQIILALGPLTSKNTRALDAGLDEGIPILSFSNAAEEVKNRRTFPFGISPRQSIRNLFDYVSRKKDSFDHPTNKVALLYEDSPWGDIIREEVAAAAETYDLEIVQEQSVQADSSREDLYEAFSSFALFEERKQSLADHLEELRKNTDSQSRIEIAQLKDRRTYGDLPYTVAVVGLNGELLRLAASLMPYYDIDPEKTLYLGTAQWGYAWVADEPAFWGGLYAFISQDNLEKFRKTYMQVFQKDPLLLTFLAYDVAYLADWSLQGALQKAQGDKPEDLRLARGAAVLANLTQPNGFVGARGLFHLQKDGALVESMSIYQLHKKRSQLLESAAAKNPKTVILGSAA